MRAAVVALAAVMAVAVVAFPTDFAQVTYYSNSDCSTISSSYPQYAGAPLDYCYWAASGYYVKATYADGVITSNTYNDTACTTGAGTPSTRLTNETGCVATTNARYMKTVYPSTLSWAQFVTGNETSGACSPITKNEFIPRDTCVLQDGGYFLKLTGSLSICGFSDAACGSSLGDCGSAPASGTCSQGVTPYYNNAAAGLAPTTAVVAAAALIAAFVSKF